LYQRKSLMVLPPGEEGIAHKLPEVIYLFDAQHSRGRVRP
jgi:hypothetical protein